MTSPATMTTLSLHHRDGIKAVRLARVFRQCRPDPRTQPKPPCPKDHASGSKLRNSVNKATLDQKTPGPSNLDRLVIEVERAAIAAGSTRSRPQQRTVP
jgi:hypothetical protein